MASSKAERKRKKQMEIRERAARRARDGIKDGSAADTPEPDIDPRLERALRKAEKQLQNQQKTEREAAEKLRLASAREQAQQAQLALSAKEDELRQRETLLQKELPPTEQQTPKGWFQRIFAGMAKTRENLTGGLARIVLGKKEIDPELLDRLEEFLYTADTGPETAQRLLGAVRERVKRRELRDPALLRQALKEEIDRVLERSYEAMDLDRHHPAVVLMVGVNGSGKTTTIGKLAAKFSQEGKKVLLAAGDTFRAAATEQLEGWGKRVGCDVVGNSAGGDPSAVIFQAVRQAIDRDYDIVLCDTAGRLHTKVNLMEELKKIKRVIGKLVPQGPHEILLVLDANTGQNAILQTRDFLRAVDITGLIVTKLDGTARGGVVIGIVNEFDLPIRYIGIGESVADLRPFEASLYSGSLFG